MATTLLDVEPGMNLGDVAKADIEGTTLSRWCPQQGLSKRGAIYSTSRSMFMPFSSS